MKLIYFLLIVLVLVYFLWIPLLFNQDKISVSELLTFLGVLPLGLVAIFQEQFKRKFFAPILIIDFEMQEPYCSKTPFYIGWPTPEGGKVDVNTEAYGFRFGVRNTGKSQAKLCEVFLAELQEFKNDQWINVEYFQQVHLKWDKGSSENQYTHVNPSPVRTLCDIGHIIKKEKGLSEDQVNKFYLSQLYIIGGYQPQHLDPNKKYRFTITVAAENASAISQKFELYWTGSWKDKPDEMFKEITIKKL